jgi:hypothetical protein
MKEQCATALNLVELESGTLSDIDFSCGRVLVAGVHVIGAVTGIDAHSAAIAQCTL